MPDVQFREETFQRAGFEPQGPRGLTGLVMRLGLAKDQKSAEGVLLVILILVVIATFFMLYEWQHATVANMPPPLPDYVPPQQ